MIRHLQFSMLVMAFSIAIAPIWADEPSDRHGSKVIPVWPDVAPGSEDWRQIEIEYRNQWDKKEMVRNVTRPTLTSFLPDPSLATGTAVIICPGGGFRFLSWESEGTEVANWLQARGVAAFVLRYRTMETAATEEAFNKEMAAFFARLTPKPKSTDETSSKENAKEVFTIPEDMRNAVTYAGADGKQAVKLIRDRAAEWGVRPDRVGIMGFSAGGMVTMNVIMDNDAKSRPDFAAPIYGGGTYGAKVAADAPPLFILCASDDHLAAASSIGLYWDWHSAGRSAELHLYEKGGHGFGMARRGLPVDGWIDRYGEWLSQRGLIKLVVPLSKS